MQDVAGAEEAYLYLESGGETDILQIQFGRQASHSYGSHASSSVVCSSRQRYDQIGTRWRHKLCFRRQGSIDLGSGVQNVGERTSAHFTTNVHII